jgi:hypothetical protein
MKRRRSGWVVVDGELKWIRPEPEPDRAELRAALGEMAARSDATSPFGGR